MAETDWKRVWRAWLKARFGDVLKGKRLKEAAAMAESFRRMAREVGSVPLDNGEAPFSNALPGPDEKERP